MSDPASEQALDDFLEGQPRAEQWRGYREALAARLRDAIAARDTAAADDPQRPNLDARVEELREMVHALAEEEAITQFVENSVRAAIARPAPPPRPGDEFDLDDEGYY